MSGIGIVRLVVWPPRKRTCRWIWSVLLSVTSSISSRAMRFAFAGGRGGVGPELGEVGRELADLGLAVLIERGVGGGGLAVVFVLGGLQRAQRVVPVGFEGVCDEPVVGVDREVSPARELGVLVGAFDVRASQLVGLVGAGFELGLDRECDLERERGDGLEQQLLDCAVDGVAGEIEADGAVALDVVVGAAVVGHERVAALVIADRHAPSAASADGEALEQCGPLAGGTGGAVGAVCMGV